MSRTYLLIAIFLQLSAAAQIFGVSASARYTTTTTGRTSLFGPSEMSYHKLYPDMIFVLENIEHAGGYVYGNVNPYLFGYSAVFSRIPPGVIAPSSPTNAPMQATDFNIMQIDLSKPFLFKDKGFNIGIGFTFLWKAEGLRLTGYPDPYLGITKKGPRFDGDFAYGAGRFVAKQRMGLGPILDAKYVPKNEKFALRAAVGAAFYGGNGGTFRLTEGDAYYAINKRISLTLKARKYTKIFSHDIDNFEQGMVDRLGDQLIVTTRDYSLGILVNGDFDWLRKLTGAYEY